MASIVDPDPALAPSDVAAGVIASLALANAQLHAALEQSLRELAQARAGMLIAGDVVRRKLGQDLHDGAQQHLIAIQIMAEMARERAGDSEVVATIEAIAGAAAQAADDLRELAQGVYPALLADRGPGDALRAAVRTSPIPVRIVDEGVARRSTVVEAAVYFCCLEAIQNAIKHAGDGAQVTVTLGGEYFEVADDGVGMPSPAAGSGMGLRSMRDRIAAVGGRFELDSSPGLGTRVRGRIPTRP